MSVILCEIVCRDRKSLNSGLVCHVINDGNLLLLGLNNGTSVFL